MSKRRRTERKRKGLLFRKALSIINVSSFTEEAEEILKGICEKIGLTVPIRIYANNDTILLKNGEYARHTLLANGRAWYITDKGNIFWASQDPKCWHRYDANLYTKRFKSL